MLAVLFGIVALVWPAPTTLALVFVFGIYAIADGVVTIARAISDKDISGGRRLLYAIHALVGIAAGVIAFAWPSITTLALLIMVAVTLAVEGVIGTITSISERKAIGSSWAWFLISSILAVVLGVVLLVAPIEGILAVVWVIGWWGIFFGIALIVGALEMRRVGTAANTQSTE